MQMNPKQLEYSIFEAVSDAIAKEWTTEEKELIQNNSKLQSRLKEWFNNSLSDTCWHKTNYKIVRDLSTYSKCSLLRDFFEDEETHIPF